MHKRTKPDALNQTSDTHTQTIDHGLPERGTLRVKPAQP